jgi:uncharacterized protein (DUF58 family)
VFLAGVFFSGLAGMLSIEIPAYHVFCVFTALYLAVQVTAQLAGRKLRVGGRMPPQAVVGEAVLGQFTVTNLSRLSAYDVSLRYFDLPRELRQEKADTVLWSLPAGETVPFPIALTPLSRGLYELPPIRAFSTFPFNLTRTGRAELRNGSLLVLPRFHPLESVSVPFAKRYQPGGIAMTSNVGESPEYIGNREYRPGDSTRRIDFRSWARLARPVVREYQEEYYCRIALVLDTYVGRRRRMPMSGHADLEAAISLTAAMTDALGRGEHIIDIFAAGPELYVLRTGRKTSSMDSILEILASLEPCRKNPFTTVAPALADELAQITTVIFVLLDWDESRRRLVRAATDAGCATKVVLVRDREPSEEIHGDASWVGSIISCTPAQVTGGGLESL